jgi:4-amino-4-deoxy-L-arabinose transferase-like glycosyltransferase
VTTPRRLALPTAVALVAVAVRLPGVYTQSFWQDEVASARILSQPTLGAVLARVARTESTPPLWYVLGWLTRELGVGMRDVRLLSVLAGAALSVATLVLARRVVGEAAAALAALLVALGGEFVAHGQELRAYELLALLAVVFATALLAEVRRPSRARDVALALTVAAGTLTHYFFAFSLAAAVAWLWLDPAARAVRRRGTAAIALGAVPAAIWTPIALRQFHQNRFWWIGPFRLRYVAATPLRLFTYAYNGTTVGLVMSVAALLLIAAGCHAAWRSPAGRLLAVLAVLPLLEAGTAWALGIRIFALRNLIAIGPFVAIAAALAVDALPRSVLRPLTAFALLAGVVVSLAVSEVGEIPPYNLMARSLVVDGWRPSIPIAVFGNPYRFRAPLEWYLPQRPVLALARPGPAPCRRLLVVTRRGRVESLRLHGPLESDPALRGATLLGDSARLPRCVRALRVRHAALS